MGGCASEDIGAARFLRLREPAFQIESGLLGVQAVSDVVGNGENVHRAIRQSDGRLAKLIYTEVAVLLNISHLMLQNLTGDHSPDIAFDDISGFPTEPGDMIAYQFLAGVTHGAAKVGIGVADEAFDVEQHDAARHEVKEGAILSRLALKGLQQPLLAGHFSLQGRQLPPKFIDGRSAFVSRAAFVHRPMEISPERFWTCFVLLVHCLVEVQEPVIVQILTCSVQNL